MTAGRADCPSSGLTPSARLLGVVGDDGRVRYLGTPAEVPEALRARLAADEDTPRRLRFTAPCATSGCAQWQDGGCSIARAVSAAPGPLPACGIRERCRWFGQEGPAACASCAWVRTDSRPLADTAG